MPAAKGQVLRVHGLLHLILGGELVVQREALLKQGRVLLRHSRRGLPLQRLMEAVAIFC